MPGSFFKGPTQSAENGSLIRLLGRFPIAAFSLGIRRLAFERSEQNFYLKLKVAK